MIHLMTVYSHVMVLSSHCTALPSVVTQTSAESLLERSDSPLIQEFPDPCSAPCENELQATRDFQSAIAPPTLTAGQLLGSSRLITKLRTYAERVSRAGLISFFGQL